MSLHEGTGRGRGGIEAELSEGERAFTMVARGGQPHVGGGRQGFKA